MQPTPYPQVNALLDDLRFQIAAVLTDRFAGLYLYGSVVSGDYFENVSDIDLLAATSADIDDHDLAALVDMHARIVRDRPAWDDRIEIAYLSTMALQTFKSRTSRMGIISPGEPLHVTEAGHDWLMNWYLVREQGQTIFGPQPREIIPPISRKEFVDAVRDHARASAVWASRRGDRKGQSYAILTLCRALYTHHFGEHVSKERAARWAQQTMPEWEQLIDGALRCRMAGDDPGGDDAPLAGAKRFLTIFRAEIAAS